MLLLVGGLIALFGISAAFSSDTAYDDRVLAATFGGGMGLFAIALTLVAFGGRDRRAWWVLWILPVFFALHVVLLGTWVPDAPLCVLTLAALWVSRSLGGERP